MKDDVRIVDPLAADGALGQRAAFPGLVKRLLGLVGKAQWDQSIGTAQRAKHGHANSLNRFLCCRFGKRLRLTHSSSEVRLDSRNIKGR